MMSSLALHLSKESRHNLFNLVETHLKMDVIK